MKQLAIVGLAVACVAPALAQQPAPFRVEEATIAQLEDALKSGRVTCRAVVEQSLRRIEAYDKNGPAINAIVLTNPEAMTIADALDRRAAEGAFAGPLHCVPMIVKDNFETTGCRAPTARSPSPATSLIETPSSCAR